MFRQTRIIYNRKMEGVPENDGFEEDKEDDEIDIDDEFK